MPTALPTSVAPATNATQINSAHHRWRALQPPTRAAMFRFRTMSTNVEIDRGRNLLRGWEIGPPSGELGDNPG
ncbi:hypothetical protein Hesp01_43370 [Herbidospora sp. NBRC 101105]|nr:hypothetical protein Hesp01_43370 [Herbidospora sp. NBRC 101105]